jgi:hypothetical protein
VLLGALASECTQWLSAASEAVRHKSGLLNAVWLSVVPTLPVHVLIAREASPGCAEHQ